MSTKQDRNLVITPICLKALRGTSLGKGELAVLWYLASTLPSMGDVVSHATLGKELSINAGNTSKFVRHLREIGFIMRGSKVGVSYHYKLNPAFFRIL